MATTRDYYVVLGVARDAGADEIKRAFRKLAMQYHPDRNPGNQEAERQFKELNEAYNVLSDPEKRRQYDTFGHAGGRGDAFGASGFGEIFDMFFGNQAGRRTARPRRGGDLRFVMELEFNEAVFGVEREIEVPRRDVCAVCSGNGAEPGSTPVRCTDCNGQGQVRRVANSVFGQVVNVVTCPRCQGAGETVEKPCANCGGGGRVQTSKRLMVKVPAGVDEGDQIRLAGEGEAGVKGGGYGDLFVAMSVRPHPVLRRSGRDVYYDLGVTFSQAALGDSIEIPTVDGSVKLEVPAGTQYGTRLRIAGHGIPHVRTGRRGDQIVVVHVITPTKLNAEQKRALESLGGRTGLPTAAPRGFLDRLRESFGF
jgi:molecular chaperone DnaJ